MTSMQYTHKVVRGSLVYIELVCDKYFIPWQIKVAR